MRFDDIRHTHAENFGAGKSPAARGAQTGRPRRVMESHRSSASGHGFPNADTRLPITDESYCEFAREVVGSWELVISIVCSGRGIRTQTALPH